MSPFATDSARIARHLELEHRGHENPVVWATTLADPIDAHMAFSINADSDPLQRWNDVTGTIIGPENLVVPSSCAHIVSNSPRRDFGLALQAFLNQRESHKSHQQ